MIKLKRIIPGIAAMIIAFSSVACYTPSNEVPKENEIIEEEETIIKNEKEEVKTAAKSEQTEGNIYDNKLLYEDEDDYSVITMYLTVSTGNEADGSNHTWEEINTYSAYDYTAMGVDRYKVEGLLQIDETGEGITEDSYGYGEQVPNVSVQVRGQTSSKSEDKNYKIRIKDGKEEFRGQRTLNVNKHHGEPYRFVNKLCYDMLENVPELMAARTQFVHLYVKDNTVVGESEYEDYGLYTMVEQINRTYLKNHGLDENGQLYKVTFFEWDEYDAVMMDPDDPEFDRSQFEKYIEIKGDEDPTKIQEIVKKVHNYNIPIDEIINEHFDEENLCYWMAYNILIGNNDVGARNLFLYSPLNSEKFYFICWDMDASFKKNFNEYKGNHDGQSWESGMTKFLGLTLVRRMMKEEKYRKMLSDAVDDIYANYVNPEIVEERVEEYRKITTPYLFGIDAPDDKRLPENLYYELTDKLPSEVDEQYEIFKASLDKPWPFFIDLPTRDEEGEVTINWGVSFDPNEEEITYDYYLATDYLFEDIITEDHGLKVPVTSVGKLDPGTYYIKVVSTNESGLSMDCFDYFVADKYGKVYGCYGFIIEEDGTVNIYTRNKK